MLIPTRVFCVLLYVQVRLSVTTFETHLWSFGASFGDLSSSTQLFCYFSLFQLLCSDLSSAFVFETTLYLEFSVVFVSNSDFFSSFMNYYLSIPLLIVVILSVCDSMIDLFTVYAKFCQI